MESTKKSPSIQPRLLVGSIALGLILLVVVKYKNRAESDTSHNRIGEPAQTDDIKAAQLKRQLSNLLAENDSLSKQIDSLKQKKQLGQKPLTFNEPRQWSPQNMTFLGELGNNPETVADLVAYLKAQQRKKYGSLYSSLKLPDEQIEKLNDLLAERAANRNDIANIGMSGGGISKTREESNKQFAIDATSLLGPEKAELVILAEQSSNWAKIEGFNSLLSSSQQILNPSQIKALLSDWKDTPMRAGVTDSELLNSAEKSNEQLLKKAATYLAPAQLEALVVAAARDTTAVKSSLWIRDQRARWFKEQKSKNGK
jgi:hypothetical protein